MFKQVSPSLKTTVPNIKADTIKNLRLDPANEQHTRSRVPGSYLHFLLKTTLQSRLIEQDWVFFLAIRILCTRVNGLHFFPPVSAAED